ncbi:double-strand break repair protein AddB [Rhizobium sp. SSA_523]|uniref:double-strand break repair protein AddB n=1 Tax=Rhizobium sp. SSA_523 TaxID=2952477 RepID=UPI002090C643|nr:double-strand break repair protein AddB [Rhizobium sp. SSA_523]MCO5734642.1 double-strand break repair protein AddB [Rhizobium sp. SSA_523]WKC23415.1 double-strand break repair protein AddB [Rhizobium sp. SSA_523]
MNGQRQKRILTVPPSVPFLRTVAAGLCDGRLLPSFRYDESDPLSLSKVTIYVPTRRAARVLRSEFVELLGGRATILPMIRPLGETDEDSGFFDVAAPEEMNMAVPISATARLLELGRLILAWRNALPQAITDIHRDSPLVAPASPADAVWLARALAELIDAIETEERDWSDLERLQTAEHSLWWQLTAEFLKIASAFWPARLEELRRSSPAKHQAAIINAEARRIAERRHDGPVIVAGSTGPVPAAAHLIAAISDLPYGAVVLPGLDLSMPDEEWTMLGRGAEGLKPDPTSRSHPQYGLYRLLQRLQVLRRDVGTLGEAPADLEQRSTLLSQALAPAEATDRWTAWRQARDPHAVRAAFADVSLVEAANEREEAAAIAIALRLALEEPGADGPAQAALITPDRALAHRVTAELARFGITADDTAGTPLLATPQGRLLTLALEAILRPGDPVAITALLKHPMACFGMAESACRPAREALELLALRGGTGQPDIAALVALLDRRLQEDAQDRHPPQWRLSLPDEAADLALRLAERIEAAVQPLADAMMTRQPDRKRVSARLTLSDWATRTGRVLEAIAVQDGGDLRPLWLGEAGERLSGVLAEIIGTDGQIEADGPQWIDIITALLTAEAVKPRQLSNPRVFIFGTLESRLQRVDTMILGGLNEGSWPDQSGNNPFLSRSMKTDIGLEPPERKIGQLAHDFEMSNGTRRLIYTRSLRKGGAPTVASRWLQRLLALGGEDLAKDLRSRGAVFRQWAQQIDATEPSLRQLLSKRPSPRPPADLQPRQYSFSEVGRLRRDPYSIYARRILKLDSLHPFNQDPGAAERGTLYHRIIDRYTRIGALPGTPHAGEVLLRITEEEFDRAQLPPHIDQVWRPRFREVGRAFLKWEAERAPDIRSTFTEVPAGFELADAAIRLTGIADRIDIKGSGDADIIDYKTGLNPSSAQARALLDPQLALEAAALRAGAFRAVGTRQPDQLLYVRLRPGERFTCNKVNNEEARTRGSTPPKSAIDLAEDSIEQLTVLVKRLRDNSIGFASRVIPVLQRDFGGDYDHLARVAEWSTADEDEGDSDE